jgi:hypothetical protein
VPATSKAPEQRSPQGKLAAVIQAAGFQKTVPQITDRIKGVSGRSLSIALGRHPNLGCGNRDLQKYGPSLAESLCPAAAPPEDVPLRGSLTATKSLLIPLDHWPWWRLDWSAALACNLAASNSIDPIGKADNSRDVDGGLLLPVLGNSEASGCRPRRGGQGDGGVDRDRGLPPGEAPATLLTSLWDGTLRNPASVSAPTPPP